MSIIWFKRVMWLGIIANLIAAVVAMAWPGCVLALLHLEPAYPLVWVRHSGLMLLALTLFYIPAALSPLRALFISIFAILARVLGIVFFLCVGGAYLWFAAYDALFAVPQAILLWRAWKADLMSKP